MNIDAFKIEQQKSAKCNSVKPKAEVTQRHGCSTVLVRLSYDSIAASYVWPLLRILQVAEESSWLHRLVVYSGWKHTAIFLFDI